MFFLAAVLFGAVSSASAQVWYNGPTGARIEVDDFYQQIRPGQVLVISELHGLAAHHENQIAILQNLSDAGYRVHLGIEHFAYPQQSLLDHYLYGMISEAEFLAQVGWSAERFADYREQILIPSRRGGATLALNLPREISGKVAREGWASLTADEQSFLPPHFTRGSETYFERFLAAMGGGHVPKEKIENYFLAQSLWDETMAWRTRDFLDRHTLPAVFVIIVGDFHVAYQDGLIARLRARGVHDVVSVSQVDTRGLSAEERQEILAPHARYGVRADFIYDVQ